VTTVVGPQVTNSCRNATNSWKYVYTLRCLFTRKASCIPWL